MRIYFQTLGCKLNQAETDQFKKEFLKEGFSITDDLNEADFCIINTCAVTEAAVRKSRQAIHKIKNQKPGCLILATGCSFEQAKEVDLFIKDKEQLILEVLKYLKDREITQKKDSKNHAKGVFKVKSMVKIQDGCDNFCSYCLISRRRGKLKSVDPKAIIDQIKELEKQGRKEVFLTGVNINKYLFLKNGKNLDLAKMQKRILRKTKIERVRLGSMDPSLVTDDLINLWKYNERLCKHWHLSLQSGSDRILEKMNRRYTSKKYLEIVKKLRKIDPRFGITTDMIVGFPGETEEDFQDSIAIVKKVGFSKVHVFPFSKRPGTPAGKMENQVLERVKQERVLRLREVEKKVSREFRLKNLGRHEKVLIEGKRKGYFEGYTGNYLRVYLKSRKNLQNQIIKLELESKHFKN